MCTCAVLCICVCIPIRCYSQYSEKFSKATKKNVREENEKRTEEKKLIYAGNISIGAFNIRCTLFTVHICFIKSFNFDESKYFN